MVFRRPGYAILTYNEYKRGFEGIIYHTINSSIIVIILKLTKS